MAVSNRGGHGVSSVAPGDINHAVKSAQPSFPDTQGPAAHKDSGGGRNWNPGRGSKSPKVAGPYAGQ
jgi:hypothetical protein